MFKLSFYSNGKFQSIEISWKFIVGLASIIGGFISGLFSAFMKGILILAIAIQGLVAGPDSFSKA